MQVIFRLVEKRASKTNSWDLATPEQRMDHFRRYYWPTLSRGLPLEFVQSECMVKSSFKAFLGIEKTKEEWQEFRKEARRLCLHLR